MVQIPSYKGREYKSDDWYPDQNCNTFGTSTANRTLQNNT